MKLAKKILNKLNGLHYPQEYLCFAKESFHQPLHVYLVKDKQVLKDITNRHLFVGYCPLVFAFSDQDLLTESCGPGSLQLIFSQQLYQPNEVFIAKDAIARLNMKIIKTQPSKEGNIFYYEGTNGSHYFLSAFQQLAGSLHNQWYNKKPGNVFLHNNLYKQVQIAYAVPRNISLISISHNSLFNLFPTDLHGQIDEQHYIISLRVGGKAGDQAEQAGKILISQVDADAYKIVYGLGKNHMQELKPKENFPFGQSLSATFNWPLPDHAVLYRELILLDSFTHGIHKIMLFKIVFSQQLQAQTSTLAHIHNSYASWRYNNKLGGNFLLR